MSDLHTMPIRDLITYCRTAEEPSRCVHELSRRLRQDERGIEQVEAGLRHLRNEYMTEYQNYLQTLDLSDMMVSDPEVHQLQWGERYVQTRHENHLNRMNALSQAETEINAILSPLFCSPSKPTNCITPLPPVPAFPFTPEEREAQRQHTKKYILHRNEMAQQRGEYRDYSIFSP